MIAFLYMIYNRTIKITHFSDEPLIIGRLCYLTTGEYSPDHNILLLEAIRVKELDIG